jgi:hypothetical protein
LPVDLVEFAQNGFELSIPAREPLDQGQHVLGNVAGPGLPVDLGSQVIGRVLETLGGDRADEEIEVIDDFLGESPLAAFECMEARRKVSFRYIGVLRRLLSRQYRPEATTFFLKMTD